MKNTVLFSFLLIIFSTIVSTAKGNADTTETGGSFIDNTDMSFQFRGSFRTRMYENSGAEARFRIDNFRMNIEGKAGNRIYWRFRQSFNADFRSNSFDNLLESVDYAFLRWDVHPSFSLTAGKQVLALGGQEFWAAPVYVISFSEFGRSFAAYQTGISSTINLEKSQEVIFQVANIRGGTDNEQYFGGLPEGVTESRFPFICTANWNGNFTEGDKLEFRYSASFGNQAKGRNIVIFTGGQSYRTDRWGSYLDLIYSRQGLDANGILSSSAFAGNGRQVTMQNVEYISAIGYLHFFLSPSFSCFLKGAFETSGLFRNSDMTGTGMKRMSWNAQTCVEYMPTKDRNDFRIFAHYDYCGMKPYGEGTKYGITPASAHTLSLGVIYIMNVF